MPDEIQPALKTPAFAPPDHPALPPQRVGVLLVNLGTPEATDYWSMRRYLKEFLSDTRVVETSRFIWWPVLNGIILTFRPSRSGANYKAIWDEKLGELPLKTITRSQTQKLGARLADQPKVIVGWAMRYGKPSIASQVEALSAQGCGRILVVPLYPQYAAATTATVGDKTFDALKKMRWQPALRMAPPWHDDESYISALADSVKAHLAGLDFEPELILASYHGIPQEYFLKGDPYHCQCAKTTRLLREKLGLSKERLMMTFQSRFGPREWLQPYTDETIKALAEKGVKRIAVLTPGFVADCLETIQEIGEENKEYFLENGGEKFARIECLNDSDGGVDVLEAVVRRELMGWV